MILNTEEVKHIYLSTNYVDMRKSIDGLALLVHQSFELDVLDHSLFLFINKSRTRIKILYYENNGFWLFLKRLEQGRFQYVVDETKQVKTITSVQLNWLLQGLDMESKFLSNNQKTGLIL